VDARGPGSRGLERAREVLLNTDGALACGVVPLPHRVHDVHGKGSLYCNGPNSHGLRSLKAMITRSGPEYLSRSKGGTTLGQTHTSRKTKGKIKVPEETSF